MAYYRKYILDHLSRAQHKQLLAIAKHIVCRITTNTNLGHYLNRNFRAPPYEITIPEEAKNFDWPVRKYDLLMPPVYGINGDILKKFIDHSYKGILLMNCVYATNLMNYKSSYSAIDANSSLLDHIIIWLVYNEGERDTEIYAIMFSLLCCGIYKYHTYSIYSCIWRQQAVCVICDYLKCSEIDGHPNVYLQLANQSFMTILDQASTNIEAWRPVIIRLHKDGLCASQIHTDFICAVFGKDKADFAKKHKILKRYTETGIMLKKQNHAYNLLFNSE